MLSTSDNTLLETYSKELGLTHTLTVEEIIYQHKSQREIIKNFFNNKHSVAWLGYDDTTGESVLAFDKEELKQTCSFVCPLFL